MSRFKDIRSAWEPAWSRLNKRWYYQNRKTGEASWKQPEDCAIDLQHADAAPQDLPEEWDYPPVAEGWQAIWDPSKQVFYFYNLQTRHRTWLIHEAQELHLKVQEETTSSDDSSSGSSSSAEDGSKEKKGVNQQQKAKARKKALKKAQHAMSALKVRAEHHTGHTAHHVQEDHEKHGTVDRYTGTRKALRGNKGTTQLLWASDTYLQRLEQSVGEKLATCVCFQDLFNNNGTLMGHQKMHVPETIRLTFDDCQAAVFQGDVVAYDESPIITLSHRAIAEAAAYFAQDSRRCVICLNICTGRADVIGGGYAPPYVDGRGQTLPYSDPAQDVEADLCRRIPNLYPSLKQAAAQGLYPLGPCTCRDIAEPNHYTSVLYTPMEAYDPRTGAPVPGACIARGSIETGYDIYTQEMAGRPVGVVTACAPNAVRGIPERYVYDEALKQVVSNRSRQDIFDISLVATTIASMFIAPVVAEPRATTLVLGLWGLSKDGSSPEMMGNLFGEAIVKGREMRTVASKEHDGGTEAFALGRLYHEIHFAMPMHSDRDQQVVDAFVNGLRLAGVEGMESIEGLGEARLPKAFDI